MKYLTKVYLKLICLCIILMNFTCNDCEEELHDKVSYEVVPFSQKIEFKIGDTLQFHTAFPSKIELEESKMIHDNSEKYVDYRFEVLELERGKTNASPAKESFHFVNLDAGTIHMPQSAWQAVVQNDCGLDTCRLAFGIVPKRSGFFGIFLRLGNLGIFECEFLSLWPSKTRDGVDSNIAILEELQISKIKTKFFIDDPDTDGRLFLFKVSE